MRRPAALAVVTILLLTSGAVLFASGPLCKEQIVCAWTLVSADSMRPDGSRVATIRLQAVTPELVTQHLHK
jgi:hypothetical protein